MPFLPPNQQRQSTEGNWMFQLSCNQLLGTVQDITEITWNIASALVSDLLKTPELTQRCGLHCLHTVILNYVRLLLNAAECVQPKHVIVITFHGLINHSTNQTAVWWHKSAVSHCSTLAQHFAESELSMGWVDPWVGSRFFSFWWVWLGRVH